MTNALTPATQLPPPGIRKRNLLADIVRPADDAKYPTILERTPYGRELLSQLEGEWWARRGYVHIVQDVRGRNDSAEEWIPFVNERKDGYDTIDWIAKQGCSSVRCGGPTSSRTRKCRLLGVLISSHMFPNYARNLNTGEPISNATRIVVAEQTIYHDAKRPSALRFRVLPVNLR